MNSNTNRHFKLIIFKTTIQNLYPKEYIDSLKKKFSKILKKAEFS